MTKITTARKPFADAKPYIGQLVSVYGKDCIIVNILPLGTIEVSALDDKHHYRISGLRF